MKSKYSMVPKSNPEFKLKIALLLLNKIFYLLILNELISSKLIKKLVICIILG